MISGFTLNSRAPGGPVTQPWNIIFLNSLICYFTYTNFICHQLPAHQQSVLHSEQVWTALKISQGRAETLAEGLTGPSAYTPLFNHTHPTESISFPQLCWWAVIKKETTSRWEYTFSNNDNICKKKSNKLFSVIFSQLVNASVSACIPTSRCPLIFCHCSIFK